MLPKVNEEKEHHRLAYYEYLDCQNLSEVARRVGYSLQSINKWFISFNWKERTYLYKKELLKKTELELIGDNVKRNLKQIKDLEQIDNVLNLLYPSVFERDAGGNILNMKGESVKQFGGVPALKLDLNSISDFERFTTTKVRVQDQIRKIQGEPDVIVDAKVKVTGIKETLKKYEEEIDAITEEVDG